MRFTIIIWLVGTLFSSPVFSQSVADTNKTSYWDDHFTLGGYVKYMNTNSFIQLNQIATDNLFHNRLNLKYYVHDHWTVKVEMRNRVFYGASLQGIPNYAKSIGSDAGVVDMSFNVINEPALLLNSTIDRANTIMANGILN